MERTVVSPPGVRYNDSMICMDTLVAIEVVGAYNDAPTAARVRRALGWFAEVESRCSRFDASSELVALCSRPGERVRVSPLLFNVLAIAVEVARTSDGAFDPCVGGAVRAAGFNRNHRGGPAPEIAHATDATFRDIVLLPEESAVLLRRPVLLDLGAVAKGFAIDLAAMELKEHKNFAINAGGDLFLAGVNRDGFPWRTGIRDPHAPERILGAIEVSDTAICTSGGYERPSPLGTGHHLVDPVSGRSPGGAASVTTIGPNAAMADALSTAAFVLGPTRGIRFLRRAGVEGCIVTSDGTLLSTPDFPEFLA